MRIWRLAGMGLVLWVLAGAAVAADCPAERAQYVLKGVPEITAGFRPTVPAPPDWSGDLAFFIRSARTGQTYWFLWYGGNGAGISSHLASTTDVTVPGWQPPPADGGPRPLGDLDILFADGDYRFDQAYVPMRTRPAPAHLLIPGLQQALWYRAPVRESVPIAFFDRDGCAAG